MCNAITQPEVDTINDALFRLATGDTHVLGVIDHGATTVREVTLTADQRVSPPVSTVRVLDTAAGPVGYGAFSDHNAPAEDALADAIETFAAEGIVRVLLDQGLLEVVREAAGRRSAIHRFEALMERVRV